MHNFLTTIFILISLNSHSQEVDPITILPDGTSKKFSYNDRMHHSHLHTNGLRFTFWDSGFSKIKTEVNIINGEMNGILRAYNEKGFLRELKTFKDGLENGYCYYWNDAGLLIKKEYYLKGVLKKTIVF